MSISAPPGAPPAAPPPGAPPPGAPAGGAGAPPSGPGSTELHDTAVDAQTAVQKLATGLAHAGASPQAVQQLTQFAEVLGQVVKVLAQSPEVEHAAQVGPHQAAVEHAVATAPAPPGGGGGPMPGAGFHQATQQLHAALAAKRSGQ